LLYLTTSRFFNVPLFIKYNFYQNSQEKVSLENIFFNRACSVEPKVRAKRVLEQAQSTTSPRSSPRSERAGSWVLTPSARIKENTGFLPKKGPKRRILLTEAVPK
jgi:hypothetical protein